MSIKKQGKYVVKRICRIAVKYPKNTGALTYLHSEIDLKVGDLVSLPLGRRKAQGCVLSHDLDESCLSEVEKKYILKELYSIVYEDFSLSKKQLELYCWISKYYHYSLGQLIFDTLPKILKRPRAIDFVNGVGTFKQVTLNEEQKYIVDSIKEKLDSFDSFYIHGVTGSGKTICYIEIIKDILNKKKSVLFLLPEINLTPQFTKTLILNFSCPIYSYHSSISASEKFTLWKKLSNETESYIVIGVRSSVFLPLFNLGLIIVDEEHDGSFKQVDRCTYNARDVAIKKAQISNCPILLGSATPMSEQFYRFKILKKDNYFTLTKRALGYFPKIEIIDETQNKNEHFWPIHEKSVAIIESALKRNEQVLVFVNRLGFAQFIQCSNCGHRFTDPNTGVNLRYFKHKNTLESNYSDFKIPLPDSCPECQNMKLLNKGFGTEKVQEVLQKIFNQYIIKRFDRDEIKNFEQLNNILDDFHSEKINLLVGTQMLSKGHNFKKVNTVLILGADSLLNFPDFRSCERVYQTIMQVAGRAGRFSPEAKVFIQSKMPEHPIFNIVKETKLDLFYNEFELNARKIAMLPPFSKIVCMYFSFKNKDKLIIELNNITEEFHKYITSKKLEIDLLGPTPLMVEKRSGQYTWALLLRSKNINQLHILLKVFEQTYKLSKAINVKIDVDPYYTV